MFDDIQCFLGFITKFDFTVKECATESGKTLISFITPHC
jgi:hypothetical protein